MINNYKRNSFVTIKELNIDNQSTVTTTDELRMISDGFIQEDLYNNIRYRHSDYIKFVSLDTDKGRNSELYRFLANNHKIKDNTNGQIKYNDVKTAIFPNISNKAIGNDEIPPVIFKRNVGNWTLISHEFPTDKY